MSGAALKADGDPWFAVASVDTGFVPVGESVSMELNPASSCAFSLAIALIPLCVRGPLTLTVCIHRPTTRLKVIHRHVNQPA